MPPIFSRSPPYSPAPLPAPRQGTIEGRRDVRGGAVTGDKRSRANAAAGAAFTSLAFSADGGLLFAGGNSKFVCVYDVAERLLLRKFQARRGLGCRGFGGFGVSGVWGVGGVGG
jgi:periodic tryptophan protein 2